RLLLGALFRDERLPVGAIFLQLSPVGLNGRGVLALLLDILMELLAVLLDLHFLLMELLPGLLQLLLLGRRSRRGRARRLFVGEGAHGGREAERECGQAQGEGRNQLFVVHTPILLSSWGCGFPALVGQCGRPYAEAIEQGRYQSGIRRISRGWSGPVNEPVVFRLTPLGSHATLPLECGSSSSKIRKRCPAF